MQFFVLRVASNKEDRVREALLRKVKIEAVEDVVGRILHGEAVATVPLGTALDNERPLSWQDVGRQLLGFLTDMSGDLSRSHSRSREHTIAQLMAAPISLVDAGLRRPLLHSDVSATV